MLNNQIFIYISLNKVVELPSIFYFRGVEINKMEDLKL
jgi:hypothetical protein